MASVSRDADGTRRILFVGPDGSRKAIYLGKLNQKSADKICGYVEAILTAKISGQPIARDAATWLTEIGRTLHKKLERVGLLAPVEPVKRVSLGEHLKDYFDRRTDVKGGTRLHWNHTKRNLLAYFGEDRELASITPGEARDWERWLRTGDSREHRYAETEADEGLAVNTVRKRIANAKQFFQDAVDHERMVRNPFAKLIGTVGSNRERDHFIDRETAATVLDACPDNQWRLLFALSRYAGLRCPSEHLALTWGDVNWADGRLLVRSAKTEHHEGKATRLVPIFPELRPHLEAVWEEAQPGTVHVITRYREANQNLRTHLKRILRKAGVAPWPKLFHNLRATRATELAAEYPSHVAAAWMGHSTLIANKHYWQVTEEDFNRAIGGQDLPAQNPAQLAAERASIEPHALPATFNNPRENEKTPDFTGVFMGGTGFEHPAEASGQTRDSGKGSAESSAVEAESDADLARIVATWPALSAATRQTILAMVEANGQTQGRAKR